MKIYPPLLTFTAKSSIIKSENDNENFVLNFQLQESNYICYEVDKYEYLEIKCK